MACKLVNTQHRDLIHDIAYDFYGKRLATCSSDRMIKIWQMSESGGWEVATEWIGTTSTALSTSLSLSTSLATSLSRKQRC